MVTKKPRVVVVMPAYNAQHTIEKTWREVVAHDVVDLVIVVDDASKDDTAELARSLDRVMVHVHPKNLGYGGNQKTCYQLALDQGADIVVMVHPDYQYTPKLIPAMAGMVGERPVFVRAGVAHPGRRRARGRDADVALRVPIAS